MRSFAACLLAIWGLWLAAPLAAEETLVDRIVAVVDDDRDADILVVAGNGDNEVLRNDLLWSYAPAEGFEAFRSSSLSAAVAGDFNLRTTYLPSSTKTMRSPALARPGTANQGRNPAFWLPGGPFSFSARRPSASQKRRRVRQLVV